MQRHRPGLGERTRRRGRRPRARGPWPRLVDSREGAVAASAVNDPEPICRSTRRLGVGRQRGHRGAAAAVDLGPGEAHLGDRVDPGRRRRRRGPPAARSRPGGRATWTCTMRSARLVRSSRSVRPTPWCVDAVTVTALTRASPMRQRERGRGRAARAAPDGARGHAPAGGPATVGPAGRSAGPESGPSMTSPTNAARHAQADQGDRSTPRWPRRRAPRRRRAVSTSPVRTRRARPCAWSAGVASRSAAIGATLVAAPGRHERRHHGDDDADREGHHDGAWGMHGEVVGRSMPIDGEQRAQPHGQARRPRPARRRRTPPRRASASSDEPRPSPAAPGADRAQQRDLAGPLGDQHAERVPDQERADEQRDHREDQQDTW